jgi:AraC-like DNA-binding protein
MRTLLNLASGCVNYISGGLFVSNGQWKHPRIILDDFELIVILKGSFSLKVNGEEKVLKENDSLLLLPNEEHYGIDTQEEKVSFYWLHFTFSNSYKIIEKNKVYKDEIIKMFPQITDFSGIFLKEEFTIVEIDRIKALIKQLLDYKSSKLYSNRPCNLLMELILMELTTCLLKREIYKGNSEDRSFMIENVCDWIRANIYKNISIQELAEHFGYNAEYFSRKFKKDLGTSPKKYIFSVQIEKAKALLCTTDLKLKEIASSVGIEDDKMFFKKFKKYECITPTQYKKIFKKTHYNSR